MSPVHVEFVLAYLIERCRDAGADPSARLDAFERTIAALAGRWRAPRPFSPAREIRMSEATGETVLGWVESDLAAKGDTLARLAVYASGALTDDSVPSGWVRVRIDPRGASPALKP